MEHEQHHTERKEGHHKGENYHGPVFAHICHKNIRGILMTTLVFLSLFLLASIVTEVKGWRYLGSGIVPTHTISVQGEGEIFAVPDIATFTFSVIKEGKDVETAQNSAATVLNKVIEYVKENGVEEKDIKTTSYNVYPRYTYTQRTCIEFPCPQEERTLVGFEINQSIHIKVRDTKKAGELLSGVGGFGVEQISSLSFTIDDEEVLKRSAQQMAIADAKEKAQALADDLGVRLVRVVNFSELGTPMFSQFERGSLNLQSISGEVAVIPVGENQIISRVNITYEIQ